ncbi:MAG: argininosuccinate lyase [Candidatus Sumerlaeaceae bacterium]|nr:argininosuccinate lyase [Candidatus Sumerlaeaceae bacterium]
MKKSKSSKPKQQFWGGRLSEAPELANVAYCAGRDVAARPMADAALVPFDIWQNRAHTAMLAKQGIITRAAAGRILRGLAEFERQFASGKLKLNPRKEDSHTNIEHFVAALVGPDASGTMHTGRSRNDQTTTVVRLCVRQLLLDFAQSLVGLIAAIQAAAAKHADVPVAGFTHYQPGSITTIGHWFAAHSQALLRDASRLVESYDRLNISPLGAAASFGTSWPIDRSLTAKYLGFASVQANTLDCVTNRWEMEADAAGAVAFAMAHLSIIAQDIIILGMPQIGILRVADRYVTGSSIMPQKRNPDFAEVTRAKSALISQLRESLFGIAKGALSGYNRDTQWTKYLVLDIFAEAQDAPAVFTGVYKTLTVSRARAEASCRRDFVDAVDAADTLAREAKVSFRQAYEVISEAVRLSEAKGHLDLEVVRTLARKAGMKNALLKIGTPSQIANAKTHEGGPAKSAVLANLKQQKSELKKFESALTQRAKSLDKARGLLAEAIRKIS